MQIEGAMFFELPITIEQLSDRLSQDQKERIVDFFSRAFEPLEFHTHTGIAVPSGEEIIFQDYEMWAAWYEKYRRRKLWAKIIVPRVLERDGGLCRRCGCKAEIVHHKSYASEVMRGKMDDQLISVCQACHKIIHFDDAGRRRAMAEWNAFLSMPN
jgi:hypothetical protein